MLKEYINSNDDTCSFVTDGSDAKITAFAQKITSTPEKSVHGFGDLEKAITNRILSELSCHIIVYGAR